MPAVLESAQGASPGRVLRASPGRVLGASPGGGCRGESKVSDLWASGQQGTGGHGRVVDFFPFLATLSGG